MDARSLIRLISLRDHPRDGADDSRIHPRHVKRVVVVAVAAASILAAMISGFSAIASATDSPAFCEAACHEMQPYHEAWTQGPHKQISCLDCHVDQGTLTRITHKFASLREVAEHIKGTVHFPLPNAPDVPNSRCVRCHASVVASTPGFSHVEHAKRGPCVKCHSDAGHSVSLATLRKAGLVAAAYRHSVEPTASAIPGNGKANLVGHKTVSCSSCHDMAATKCVGCHAPAPNHQKRSADCTQCHSPGLRFAFTHPQRADCASCHTPPKNLKPAHTWKGTCTKCHVATPGADWKFTHPNAAACGDCHTPPKKHDWSGSCTYCHRAGAGKSFAFTHPPRTDCATCHSRPQGHRSGNCVTCHRNRGVNWAFSHPGSSATCTSCHSRPSKHSAGSCTSCHRRTGSSWAFTHPSVKSGCTECHKRPSKHESGSCQTCHKRTGRSWAFTHPSVKSGCTSCHSKPSNHYGSNCSACHSPGTAWANAHFTHPIIPGGEHTNKSFACSKCHPSGPPAHYCSCHGSANGPSGD
jgi:hypothetical protein